MSEKIILDAEEIEQWQAKADDLKRQIAALQKDLSETEGDIAAAMRLRQRHSGQRDLIETSIPQNSMSQNRGRQERPEIIRPDTMTKALEMVANASPAPVTKTELRGLLAEMGFEGQGPYLYSVIMRLKNRGKITVLSDGKVWRAPPQQ
jgi:hypothetical protein